MLFGAKLLRGKMHSLLHSRDECIESYTVEKSMLDNDLVSMYQTFFGEKFPLFPLFPLVLGVSNPQFPGIQRK